MILITILHRKTTLACLLLQVREESKFRLTVLKGMNDPRVNFWEGMKFVAKLRSKLTNPTNATVVLSVVDSGHFGSSGWNFFQEKANHYAYLMSLVKS